MIKSSLLILFLLLSECSAQNIQMNVLFPPDTSEVQTYLMDNPYVSGVDIVVNWSDVDQGNGNYTFSTTDNAIAPWIKAGKIVNLVVWANSNSAAGAVGNASVPDYIWTALGSSNYVVCNTQAGAQRMPNYLDTTAWTVPYQKFISALIGYYAGKVGYIRFGLGHGGETIPAGDWNSTDACGIAYKAWGLTISTWESYLQKMLIFEAGFKAPQIMVGITPMGTPSTQVPNFIVSIAAPLGIGFGSQGLESSDLAGCATSTAGWCQSFQQYPEVPHELQTIGQSCPAGSGCTGNQELTGPLPPLLAFGVVHGATIFEVYYEDWLLAFDPAYLDYGLYGLAYSEAIESVKTLNSPTSLKASVL